MRFGKILSGILEEIIFILEKYLLQELTVWDLLYYLIILSLEISF